VPEIEIVDNAGGPDGKIADGHLRLDGKVLESWKVGSTTSHDGRQPRQQLRFAASGARSGAMTSSAGRWSSTGSFGKQDLADPLDRSVTSFINTMTVTWDRLKSVPDMPCSARSVNHRFSRLSPRRKGRLAANSGRCVRPRSRALRWLPLDQGPRRATRGRRRPTARLPGVDGRERAGRPSSRSADSQPFGLFNRFFTARGPHRPGSEDYLEARGAGKACPGT